MAVRTAMRVSPSSPTAMSRTPIPATVPVVDPVGGSESPVTSAGRTTPGSVVVGATVLVATSAGRIGIWGTKIGGVVEVDGVRVVDVEDEGAVDVVDVVDVDVGVVDVVDVVDVVEFFVLVFYFLQN